MECWTTAIEEQLLRLWFEAKTRYQNKMKKDTKKRQWILDELQKFCLKSNPGQDVAWLRDMADKILKNKIDYMKGQGRKLLLKHVKPKLSPQPKPTGSANESGDEGPTGLITEEEWDVLHQVRCVACSISIICSQPLCLDNNKKGDCC